MVIPQLYKLSRQTRAAGCDVVLAASDHPIASFLQLQLELDCLSRKESERVTQIAPVASSLIRPPLG